MSHGKAAHKLWRSIMFKLVQQTEQDICYRCQKRIATIKEFSIEHKESWQLADNPRKTFFDLDNISFSHQICNSRHGNSIVRIRVGNRTTIRHNKKFTDEQAKQIKQLILTGKGDRAIASMFGVHPKTIYCIRSNVTFKHVVI